MTSSLPPGPSILILAKKSQISHMNESTEQLSPLNLKEGTSVSISDGTWDDEIIDGLTRQWRWYHVQLSNSPRPRHKDHTIGHVSRVHPSDQDQDRVRDHYLPRPKPSPWPETEIIPWPEIETVSFRKSWKWSLDQDETGLESSNHLAL